MEQLLPKDALRKVCDMYYKYLKNRDERLILTYKDQVPFIYYETEFVCNWNDCVLVLINFYDDYEYDIVNKVVPKKEKFRLLQNFH